MEKEKSKFIREVVIFCGAYIVFIGLKALGILHQPWWSVLLFPFWYVFVSFGFSLAFWAVIGAVTGAVTAFSAVKAWRRRRKVDRRVIAQAKATGVWDKPQCLGGRALELKAWKLYRIKREPGEPDFYLRRRCIVKANAEYSKADGYTTKITLTDERHEEEPK